MHTINPKIYDADKGKDSIPTTFKYIDDNFKELQSTMMTSKTMIATSNITLTATTSSQKLFGTLGENGDGSFNVELGRYRIEMILTLTNIGTGSIGFITGLGDGTSVFSNIQIAITAFKGGLTGTPNGVFTRMTSFTSNPNLTGTTTNTNGFVSLVGQFSVTTGGKFYPAISLNQSIAGVNNAGSFVTITKI